mgnify:CR=1 FL=1
MFLTSLENNNNNKKNMNENKFENHPLNKLIDLAKKWNLELTSKEFAQRLDNENIWPTHREKFYYPKLKDLSQGK